MNNTNKLHIIKSIHTLIWVFFNVVLFYMAYAVITNKINKYLWIGIGCIVVEWMVLLYFKWQCPLTILARKYSNSTRENFDIYLPNFLAKYNKPIYISFFIVILFGIFIRFLTD